MSEYKEEIGRFIDFIRERHPDFYEQVCKRNPNGYGMFSGLGFMTFMNEICGTKFPDWESNEQLVNFMGAWRRILDPRDGYRIAKITVTEEEMDG